MVWRSLPAKPTRGHNLLGDTVATDFVRRAAATPRRAELGIEVEDEPLENPVYCIRHVAHSPAQSTCSKILNRAPNPTTASYAVMTCYHAQHTCSVVVGCAPRASHTLISSPKARMMLRRRMRPTTKARGRFAARYMSSDSSLGNWCERRAPAMCHRRRQSSGFGRGPRQ